MRSSADGREPRTAKPVSSGASIRLPGIPPAPEGGRKSALSSRDLQSGLFPRLPGQPKPADPRRVGQGSIDELVDLVVARACAGHVRRVAVARHLGRPEPGISDLRERAAEMLTSSLHGQPVRRDVRREAARRALSRGHTERRSLPRRRLPAAVRTCGGRRRPGLPRGRSRAAACSPGRSSSDPPDGEEPSRPRRARARGVA